MIDAVFISDLHLHPDRQDILDRFDAFLAWVGTKTRALYILGDFFHLWAGDDTATAWSDEIASKLALLSEQGIKVYFMRGNRDFLLGAAFLKRAKMIALEEPSVITLGDTQVLLVHGDRYCTHDKAHQYFRRLTRNTWFPALFMCLPQKLRIWLAMGVRSNSETNTSKEAAIMQVVPDVLVRHLQQSQVDVVIHGHTHQPGVTTHVSDQKKYQQYVLSDWDAIPSMLCYNKSTGFNFKLMKGDENA
jgi:UDP-2,3-diacylglucosamine hydrolase